MTRRCPTKHRNRQVMGAWWLWCPDCGAQRLNAQGRVAWTYPQAVALTKNAKQRRMDTSTKEPTP